MKKSHRPQTRVKNPEPNPMSPDWVVWAAWADRITFEDIKKKTGKTENEVIKIMRKTLSHPHFAFGEKEQKIKVLNIEKNLKFREKK